MKRLLFLLASAIIFLVVLPLFIYRVKFNGGLSDDHSAWGTFGDYLNPFVSLFNALAFIYLTYIIHEYEKKREHRRTYFPQVLEVEREMQKISASVGAIITVFDARNALASLYKIKQEFETLKLQSMSLNPKSPEYRTLMHSLDLQERALEGSKYRIKQMFLPAGDYSELINSLSKVLDYRHTLQAVGVQHRRISYVYLALKYEVQMEAVDGQGRLETLRNPEHLEYLVKLDEVVKDQLKILQAYLADKL